MDTNHKLEELVKQAIREGHLEIKDIVDGSEVATHRNLVNPELKGFMGKIPILPDEFVPISYVFIPGIASFINSRQDAETIAHTFISEVFGIGRAFYQLEDRENQGEYQHAIFIKKPYCRPAY